MVRAADPVPLQEPSVEDSLPLSDGSLPLSDGTLPDSSTDARRQGDEGEETGDEGGVDEAQGEEADKAKGDDAASVSAGSGRSTETATSKATTATVQHSPRRPPPEVPEWKAPNLSCPETLPAKDVHQLLGPDPWMPGGCGVQSQRKTDRERAMHFDPLWKSENMRLSPDRTSATCRGLHYGGFVVSSQPLDKKPFGRWFEVVIEEVDPSRWSDGLGIGVAVISTRDAALTKIKNAERVINGFAYEVIPESWLLGYDGRAKFCGLSRYLQVTELINGMWRPNELRSGDVVGLLITADGNLMLFVNEEVRYYVRCGVIPWKQPICAVVDLDGATKSVHLANNNGEPSNKVVHAWHATLKASAPAA